MKNYTKYSVILCLTSILSSCAALEMISSILPSSSVPSISADLQVGDDKNIDSAENVNIIEEGSPWWVYLLIVIPWFLMTPGDIVRKLKNRKK